MHINWVGEAHHRDFGGKGNRSIGRRSLPPVFTKILISSEAPAHKR